MNRDSVNLNFHETFAPDIKYISEILKLAYSGFEGEKEEISALTGIPTGESSGKVVPHIKYSKYMGIIDYELREKKFKFMLTNLGRIMYMEDKYLMERISKYMLNYFICDEKDGAPQWSFIFNNFSYSLENKYNISDLEIRGMEYFAKPFKITVLKSMYTGGYGFDNLNIITAIDNKSIQFNMTEIDYDALYVYAYTLLYSWEKYLCYNPEVTIDDIINVLKWNRKFGFDYVTTLNALDELENLGVVKINKQLNPITIIKTASSEGMINRLYDLAL